jgi:hypothetical protein
MTPSRISEVQHTVNRLTIATSSALGELRERNHTIAERMYRHDPTVMLHAPLRTLIWGGPDGAARLSVDQPSSHFGGYGRPEIAAVGVDLDRKLATLLAHLGVDVPESLLTSGPASTASVGD